MCDVLLVEPVKIFSLGKRTQYGMIKMQTNEEAWQFVRDVKTKGWVRKFEGYDLWATKSYPKDERDRTQPCRKAVWAIRKAIDKPNLDLEVDYPKLQVFVGDQLVGKVNKGELIHAGREELEPRGTRSDGLARVREGLGAHQGGLQVDE